MADTTNKANFAKEANKATDASGANEADVIDKPGKTEAHEADELTSRGNKAKANEAGELSELAVTNNEAVDELDELVVEESLHADNVEKVSKITVHLYCCWRPFSLTKCCAIFSKDKGYFCPIANNNQLGGGSMGFNR